MYLTTRGGRVAALDAQGTVVWESSAGQGIYDASATVAGDMVVTAGLRGLVAGLDRRTGAVRWRRQVGPGYVLAGVAAQPGRAVAAQTDGTVSMLSW
jgi:outer membrane protein assembly factor BamB